MGKSKLDGQMHLLESKIDEKVEWQLLWYIFHKLKYKNIEKEEPVVF